MRRFQEEDPPPLMVTIPLRHSNLKLQPLLQPKEDTPWPNTMPASANLFVARASWPFPPSETAIPMFIKTEKAEERTPPKIAAIPHMMVSKPPQAKVEEMCGWGPHCPICAKSTSNPKTESS